MNHPRIIDEGEALIPECRIIDREARNEINGYTIKYNRVFGGYDITHPAIGFVTTTRTIEEAVELSING